MRTCLLLILLLNAACGSDQSAKKPEAVLESPAPSGVELSEDQMPSAVNEEEDLQESAAPTPSKKVMDEMPSRIITPPATIAPKPSGETTTPIPITEKGFVDLARLDPSIRLDIRYATTDNFTKAKIYDCARCLLRPEAAEAIVSAHKALKKQGLGLKMFDCYRPRPYQQRLWDKVPNPDYVTPPSKGSMHSRGAAVDLTIVDSKGNELDMGTPYDYFGREAHTDNNQMPQKVLANRWILREAMESVGLKGIRTEWWHFSYQRKVWPLSDYVWPCDQ
ncbi:MAG: D-alanyl-D-alanine dipeptidase [Saprospiraceae bacterium]|nr:D-alanyl-D-alanine dipeptidase [Saprospiraceae bacterium]